METHIMQWVRRKKDQGQTYQDRQDISSPPPVPSEPRSPPELHPGPAHPLRNPAVGLNRKIKLKAHLYLKAKQIRQSFYSQSRRPGSLIQEERNSH